MIEDNQINLSNRIIDHLRQKEGRKDVLDGIVIAIYEKEMKRLAENIMKDLADLIAREIINECKNYNGICWYKLSNKVQNDLNVISGSNNR